MTSADADNQSEDLEARRRKIREEFLNNMKSVGINDDEAVKAADMIEKSVSAAVAELVKHLPGDS